MANAVSVVGSCTITASASAALGRHCRDRPFTNYLVIVYAASSGAPLAATVTVSADASAAISSRRVAVRPNCVRSRQVRPCRGGRAALLTCPSVSHGAIPVSLCGGPSGRGLRANRGQKDFSAISGLVKGGLSLPAERLTTYAAAASTNGTITACGLSKRAAICSEAV